MLIKELHLLTNDLEQTENFYHSVLELSLIDSTSSSVSFSAGYTLLRFLYTNKGKPFYHFAFDIAHNKIEEALHWIESKTAAINIEGENKIADFRNWKAKAFYFYDNNGSILEFIARFDVPNAIHQPFDVSAICSVSEIGWVVDDVQNGCKALLNNSALSYFSKQPALKNFAAVGDDNGLFIVVPEGRPWYPTEKPAGKFYTEVYIDSGKGKEVLQLEDEK